MGSELRSYVTNQMERIYQMHVVPDVVPTIRPAVDIRVSFTESVIQKPSSPCIPVPQKKWATDLSDVVPGLFISPAKVNRPTQFPEFMPNNMGL